MRPPHPPGPGGPPPGGPPAPWPGGGPPAPWPGPQGVLGGFFGGLCNTISSWYVTILSYTKFQSPPKVECVMTHRVKLF